MRLYSFNMSQSITNRNTQIIPKNKYSKPLFMKKSYQEMKNLYSRGYSVHDIYYDGEVDTTVYTQPEFKSCPVKNTKTDIEIFIDKGNSVYDIFYDSP